ncbi:MAG: hypothetical protein M1818_004632 [Claussenomyces sp. TS43310]|nr:MAG: hypothetical protein M1818_004632 [Claussenomyces sp. TS43310]
MSEVNSWAYKSLPSKTSIRVLLVAPGAPDDEIFCWLLPVDLDADHKRFPSSSPRPVDIISVVIGTTSAGQEVKFLLPFDVYWDDSKPSPPMHPFQRYTALSYVWGNPANPSYIILNGEKRFFVTQNLCKALKALRSASEGLCIWVDAICINQTDYEEKKIQIGLMKRVYQQAEKVIAYVPQTEEDQRNIQELVYKIWTASKKYEEKKVGKEGFNDQREDKNRQIGLIPVPVLEPIMVEIGPEQQDDHSDILKYAAQLQELHRRDPGKAQFLEDFGLPPLDSPLWGSWRRFFASPYFRRIWILQEFTLANNLHFCFGTGIASYEPIMVAFHFIKEYSGVVNAHYLGYSHNGDPEQLTQLAMAGARGAETMFLERVLADRGSQEELLIEKLRHGRSFGATDPRDKIYALLALAKDGELFADHITYAPDETPAKVFTRFAGLFVEGGYIFEVLLQAGIRSCDAGLPSWVPNWSSSHTITATLSSSENQFAERTSGVKILPDNKLLIRGTLTDEIRHLSNAFNQMSIEGSEQPPFGGRLTDFMKGLVNGFLLVLNVLVDSQQSFEEAMEVLFQVLIQKETSSDRMPTDADEIKCLRSGFGSCLGFLQGWATALADIEEGKTLVVKGNSPDDSKMFHQFLQRASQTTAQAKLCVTSQGCVGLVPDRTEVGDRVSVFHGSPNQFILRKFGQEEGKEDDEIASYRLVGSGYLRHLSEGTSLSHEPENYQNIRLI